jgi:hypothetical protein
MFITAKAYAGENSNFAGLYLSGNIGLVDTNMGGANTATVSGTSATSTGLSSSKTAFAFDLNAGYNYAFKNTPLILGLGLIYLNNSKITANGTLTYQGVSYPESISYDSYSYGVYLEPGVVVQKKILIYGRLGETRNHIGSASQIINGYTANFTTSSGGGSLYYALGVQYLVTNNIGINFEWDAVNQSISYSGTLVAVPNTHLHNNDFLIGLSYYFGNI